jgi:hypothetical protein
VVFLALWALPVLAFAATLGARSVFVEEGVFFAKAAVVTFGGATLCSHTSRSRRWRPTAG